MASKMLQDRPKTAPRGSGRATFSLLKIVLNLDSFWIRFWSILGPKSLPKNLGGAPPFRSKIGLVLTCYLCHILIASKTAQDASKSSQDPLKTTQEAPKCAPGGSKRPPRGSQEAPRGVQETPGAAGQEGSRPSKIAPKGSKRTLSQ